MPRVCVRGMFALAVSDKMKQVGAPSGSDITETNGRGEFLGGDTREEGHAAYRAVIDEYEKAHEPYRRRDRRVACEVAVADYRRGTHAIVSEAQEVAESLLHWLEVRYSEDQPRDGSWSLDSHEAKPDTGAATRWKAEPQTVNRDVLASE